MHVSPDGEFLDELKRVLSIADEVVIHDEYFAAPAEFAQAVQLGDELSRRFGAQLAAIDRDDVAEVALERAAARKLHWHGGVFVHAQQIEPRNRATGYVRLVRHPVHALRGAVLQRLGDVGEDLLGLAHHHVVGFQPHDIGLARRPRPAYEGTSSQRSRAAQNRQRIDSLRVHGTDHHQVGTVSSLRR